MVSMDKAFMAKKQASSRGADLKLFVRDVRDRQGRKRPITVRSWSTIKDVKDTIQQAIHIPASSQRLFFGPLMTSGKELPNHRSLQDAGIYRSGETILLDIKGASLLSLSSMMSAYSLQQDLRSDVCISSSVFDATPKLLRQLVQRSRRALALGLKPEFILEGSGGTYFLHDARKVKIAVFKPADEEPYAENNPRGYLQQAGQNMYLREGVVPGEACIREVAAFMLDHGGFSGVPMTTLVEARHPSFNTNGARLKVSEGGASIGAHSISENSKSATSKKVGSFQEFVGCECSMDDISPSMISVDEVHKIAILDIRLMNADRNSANLLCRRKRDNSIELVPIDHGFCLRSVADVSWMDWCWLDWPQLKQPMSKATKEYILKLDIEKDARLLKERLNISRDALDIFCASSSLLKAGVKAGLSLYDIAVMCCRNDDLGETPSKLEMLFSMASELAESAIENGRWHHAAASRALEEQLAPHGGSLLSQSSGKVHKAASAVNLSHYSDNLSLGALVHANKKEFPPGMIQSSASDSSSDNGCETDREDYEEWAVNLIAVSLEKSFESFKKPRSISIGSEDSNDSEGQGFWCTNPKDSPDPSDDEESVTWSPQNSPTESSFFVLANPSRRNSNSYNPFSVSRRASLTFPPEDVGDLSLQQFHSTSKVTFADVDNHEREDRGLDSHPEYKHSNSDVGPSEPRRSSVLRRSQSYSALTSTHSEKVTPEEETAEVRRLVDPEQHRDYFLKFIDLVIVRETTAASLQKVAA